MLRMATARRNVLRITVNDAIGGAFGELTELCLLVVIPESVNTRFFKRLFHVLRSILLSPFLDACGEGTQEGQKALGP